MEGLTPACADDLPPVGKLIVDEPFWRHPRGPGPGRRGAFAYRTIAADPPGYVVTEIGPGNSVTESAGRIGAGLVRWYGPPLVLLEHHLAPGLAEGVETLDPVRIGAGSPHGTRGWPAPQDNPRHAGLEVWIAGSGHLIVGRPDRRAAAAGRTGPAASSCSGIRT